MTRKGHLGRLTTILVAGWVMLVNTGSAEASKFQFRLSNPIMYGVCPSSSIDQDRDCLIDDLEDDLAGLFQPVLMYDEEEHCGLERTWIQVRPFEMNRDVNDWNPGGSQAKYITVSYFFERPIQCTKYGEHAGDNEMATFMLKTYDLQTFWLEESYYQAHYDTFQRPGSWTKAFADHLGSPYPVIAPSANYHGLYTGDTNNFDAEKCGKDSDWPVDDCFFEKPRDQYNNGNNYTGYIYPTGVSNRGEANEWIKDRAGNWSLATWPRHSVVLPNGGVVYWYGFSTGYGFYTYRDWGLGQGLQVEYVYNPPSPEWWSNCGYVCRAIHRKPDAKCDHLQVPKGPPPSFSGDGYSRPTTCSNTSNHTKMLKFQPGVLHFQEPYESEIEQPDGSRHDYPTDRFGTNVGIFYRRAGPF